MVLELQAPDHEGGGSDPAGPAYQQSVLHGGWCAGDGHPIRVGRVSAWHGCQGPPGLLGRAGDGVQCALYAPSGGTGVLKE